MTDNDQPRGAWDPTVLFPAGEPTPPASRPPFPPAAADQQPDMPGTFPPPGPFPLPGPFPAPGQQPGSFPAPGQQPGPFPAPGPFPMSEAPAAPGLHPRMPGTPPSPEPPTMPSPSAGPPRWSGEPPTTPFGPPPATPTSHPQAYEERPGPEPWQPVVSRSANRLPVIVLAVALLVLAATAGGIVLQRNQNSTGEPAAGPGTQTVAADTPPPETQLTEAQPTETQPTETQSTVPEGGSTGLEPTEAADPQAEALAELEELRQQDVATVVPAGQFVAQIASKHPGIEDPLQTAADGSHTFQAGDILAEHQRLREAHGDAEHPIILLKSTDYGKRQLKDGQPLWVTFAVGDFPDKQSVLDWCADQFSDLTGTELRNQCDARTLRSAG